MSEMINDMMDENIQQMEENEETEAMDEQSVGYSPESLANAWRWYESMPEKERAKALQEHSRNSHIIRVEMARMKESEKPEETIPVAEGEESVGYYSSDYYERRMAKALEEGNTTMYKNAKADWAEAKVRESVGAAAEQEEETQESEENENMGYSSDYYEHQMASALKNGNKIAYDNAKDSWAKAVAKEQTH